MAVSATHGSVSCAPYRHRVRAPAGRRSECRPTVVGIGQRQCAHMDEAAISVRALCMTYKAPVRDPGIGGALRGLVRRRTRDVEAVREVSFDVAAGEIVGFIGPNRAGKTTTLKILSGVLHPTGGDAVVLGARPWTRPREFPKAIALIRGSRPFEPFGELTVMDILRFQRLVYEVPHREFDANLAELTDLLDLEPVLHRQVRALSVG